MCRGLARRGGGGGYTATIGRHSDRKRKESKETGVREHEDKRKYGWKDLDRDGGLTDRSLNTACPTKIFPSSKALIRG